VEEPLLCHGRGHFWGSGILALDSLSKIGLEIGCLECFPVSFEVMDGGLLEE
jgi:hypothetical protein